MRQPSNGYVPAINVAPVLFIACIAALLLCKGSLSIANYFRSVTPAKAWINFSSQIKITKVFASHVFVM